MKLITVSNDWKYRHCLSLTRYGDVKTQQTHNTRISRSAAQRRWYCFQSYICLRLLAWSLAGMFVNAINRERFEASNFRASCSESIKSSERRVQKWLQMYMSACGPSPLLFLAPCIPVINHYGTWVVMTF